jgi:hypothetical protein
MATQEPAASRAATPTAVGGELGSFDPRVVLNAFSPEKLDIDLHSSHGLPKVRWPMRKACKKSSVTQASDR